MAGRMGDVPPFHKATHVIASEGQKHYSVMLLVSYLNVDIYAF